MYYTDKRHETGGKPRSRFELEEGPGSWRVQSRVKTVFAGLMLCLNIGVDPPDIVKTSPTATLEAWVDPVSPSSPNTKIMESIGKSLQSNYETLSLRIRYKQFLDPSVEEVRRCCVTLRRNAKDERVLFHYNGHGVPLPTPSGEIWYFNRNYTQYIPVSLYDLQMWLGGPSIYVLDASHAGNVLANFGRFIERHEAENAEALDKDANAPVLSYADNILLAACGKDELLPTNPDLPADLFTSCLTTPVAISLRCFFLQSQLGLNLTLRDLDKVPGKLQERRSPLGELNWIFTAITDTIAWNCLPRGIFKKLFRQDLMVAALFRNYLLADRLMRQNGCHPETEPSLPPTHEHPLWQAWDLALEMVLTQLPEMIDCEEGGTYYEYKHSSFFAEQLTAFEVYLSQGALERKAPDQLPIVLQVLLSQVHRLRALILLSRFLDLGPWAVKLALNIGIFPYVLKLLQSAAIELKPVLIFIWARILAVDNSCQNDLIRDNGYKYFLSTIQPEQGIPVANYSEHKAMAAFIIAMFCKDFHQAKVVSLSRDLFLACIGHLRDRENPLLRQWCCLCISTLWKDFPEAKWTGTQDSTHQTLCQMVLDPVPEVRAAAIHALTTFLGYSDITEQVSQTEQAIASALTMMTADGSSMVRNELLVFFSTFIKRYENKFIVAAYEELVEEHRKLQEPVILEVEMNRKSALQFGRVHPDDYRPESKEGVSKDSVHSTMWKHVLVLTVDPHADVAQNAAIVSDYVHGKLLSSPLKTHARALMDDMLRLGARAVQSRPPSPVPLPRLTDVPIPPADTSPKKSEGYFSRTASAVFSTLGFRTPAPHETESSRTSPPKSIDGSRNGPHIRTRAPDDWSRPPDAHDPLQQVVAYERAKIPLPRGFEEMDELTQAVKKLGDGAADCPIPLKSTFFEWSTEVSFAVVIYCQR